MAHRAFEESPQTGVLVSPAAGEEGPFERAAMRFADFSGDLLGIAGFDGLIKWVNAAHERLLGYSPGELIGRAFVDLIHREDRHAVEAGSKSFEVRVRARDGSYRWFLFSATPDPGHQLVYTVGKEVSDRHATGDELAVRLAVATALAEGETADEAFETMLGTICAHTGWELGQLWLRRADGTLGSAPGWHGAARFDGVRRLSEAFAFKPGVGLPGRALSSGEPVAAADLTEDGEFSRGPFARRTGLRAGLAIPAFAGEEVVAVLEFLVTEVRDRDHDLMAGVFAAVRDLGDAMRRKDAESRLREGEHRLAAVARGAADPIVSIDDDHNITFLNDAAVRAFGHPADQIVGKPVSNILRDLDEDTALTGERVELRAVRKGGLEVPVEAACSAQDVDGERLITIVLRDVTERRRTADAMHEAEERFRGAFEQAPIGIALVSIEADRAGCLLRVNRALRDLTGYSEDELIGLDLTRIVDPEGADDSDRRYVPWMLAGELSSYETDTRMRHADGHVLDVFLSVSIVRDARERPLYLIVQLQDITARREAEQQLQETGERMQAILDNTTAVVYLKDLEGRYLLVNREFEALFGATRDEVIGRVDRDVFAPEVAELLRSNDLRVLRERLPIEIEETIPVGDRARTYLSIKFPLVDSSRRPYAVCGISTDITERKRGEEALRSSEQHFREIVNTAHEAFVSNDESGRITAWNPEAETTFGWSEQEALGRNLAETIIPARHRGSHARGLQQFLQTGHATFLNRRIEMEALHRDGHEFPVEMTTTAVRLGNRYAFNSFLHDIGERKQAEEALRQLAGIIDASGDAIFATSRAGEITSWNAGAEQLYGYTAEEAVGADIDMLVGPQRRSPDLEALSGALDGRPLEDYEADQLRKDGTLVPVSLSLSPIRASSGALIGASVIARDRTERKRAEEALREVQEAFRSAFDEAPIGMALFSVDPADDGRLLQVNGSLSEITGYTREELLRMSLHAVTHPLDQERELPLAEDLISGTIPNYKLEKRFVRSDGAPMWVLHNVSTVHDASGRLLYGIAQVQDITERKRAEEGLARVAAELEKRAIELERSNADLQQFAYVASHDLSEPLRMVSSYVQLLERRYSDQLDQDAHEFIEFAVDGVNRMQRLIEDLLAYSRVGTSEYRHERVDTGALVEDTLGGMRATVADTGAIVTHDELPTVVGDESQLRQLFQNLISNGIKFVQEGPPRIHLAAERQAHAWSFAVADNGIGIDPQHAERIFAVFKRLHGRDAYPGSGIGLSICKRIVERHGGRIWVEANEGGGSRFCFTLPDPQGGE